uniref:MBD domain-containing protein n=1 Tax=Steinernema glaseri TaxID=37863 RepID=A0A1I7ZL34_9BILA
MFGIGSGLSSSRDRVSPQAIQDLLEVTRLSGGMRRAASPDSRMSSRSPSPPNSSGRASPSFALVQRSFLKVGTNSTAPGGLIGLGGGMRKLSSSPHLLGICEEGEEGSDTSSAAPAEDKEPTGDMLKIATRGTRSASTGVSTVGGRSSFKSGDSVTYSSVRMIRARQAVVSPDLCRRYDQHHQRLITRTKRSTSCSSSEASDDDSNERRLNLLSMKYCSHRKDKNDDEDPPQAGSSSDGPNGWFRVTMPVRRSRGAHRKKTYLPSTKELKWRSVYRLASHQESPLLSRHFCTDRSDK